MSVALAVAVVHGEPLNERAWSDVDESIVVRMIDDRPTVAEATWVGVNQLLDEGHDYVGFWGADAECPPSFVDALLQPLREGKTATFASRLRVMQRRVDGKWWRHYLGRVLASAISYSLTVPIYDTQCRAKLFRNTELVRRVFAEPFRPMPTFEVELLARMVREQGPDFDMRVDCEEVLLPEWTPTPRARIRPHEYPTVVAELVRIGQEVRRVR